MTDVTGDSSQNISQGETGRRLKAAREAAGMDLQTLADQLHLRPIIVRAIEEGDYAAVPSELFLKGYIRSYARHLGVSDDEMINLLSQELAPEPSDNDQTSVSAPQRANAMQLEEARRRRRLMSLGGIALVVLILLLLPFIWPDSGDQPQDGQPQETPQTAPEEPVDDPAAMEEPVPQQNERAVQQGVTATPTGASAEDIEPALGQVEIMDTAAPDPAVEPEAPSPAQAAPANPENAGLLLTFTADCWVEVVNSDGERVVARLATAGDTIRYDGQGPLRVLLGAVSAVESAQFMGQDLDLSSYPSRAGRVDFRLAN